MRPSKLLSFLLVAVYLTSLLSTAGALTLVTGDVEPADPHTWNSSTMISVGNSYAGSIDMKGAIVSSDGCLIGIGSVGAVTVGCGSQWTSGAFVGVGGDRSDGGNGILNITGGSTVTSQFSYISMGTATIDGTGSTWVNTWTMSDDYAHLLVGNNASGILNITNGGNASDTNASIGGHLAGATGLATIDGLGSKWANSGWLHVGSDIGGTLSITNGASVTDTAGYIAYGSGIGSVVVDGPSSMWSNSWTLWVGYQNHGTLNITNGGSVNSVTGNIGGLAGSAGTVTVAGSGSVWTNTGTSLYVGGTAPGTLNIMNGGTVSAGSATTYVANTAGASGIINFGPGGGTLTTKCLYAANSRLAGTGTINACGLVGDADLLFDSKHGLVQAFTLTNGITVNLNESDLTNVTDLGVGNVGSGSLVIRDGLKIHSHLGFLGYDTGSIGKATVAGAGSEWNNSGNLYVGDSGNGALNVTDGAMVGSARYGYIGANPGSMGTATVDGTGSKWLVGQTLCVGWGGTGVLNIANGGSVTTFIGTLGSSSASSGTATIAGVGSQWVIYRTLNVGNRGSGRLNIFDGGSVHDEGFGYLGYGPGSTGVVTVDGAGSKWFSRYTIYVGYRGNGTLNITGAGNILAGYDASVGGESVLAIDVGRNSSLAVKGSLENSGTVRVLAPAAVAAGATYTPISAGTWSGNGTYQAVGGTWDAVNHKFTVSATKTGVAGNAVNLDLTTTQRALVSDAVTGWKIGGSFLAATTTMPLTLTATTISSGTLTLLSTLLGTGETVLSGWSLVTAGGYNVGDPAYLSFGVGPGQMRDDLQVWQYSEGSWSKFSAFDLTYDNHYASLTVLAMGVYAVTGDIVIQGDANHDGTVNSNDLGLMLTHYNETVVGDNGWAIGDFNGDGTVNSNDLGLFLTHYNQSIPSTAPVPEPGTLMMLVMALAFAAIWASRNLAPQPLRGNGMHDRY